MSDALEELRAELRDIDRRLLLALAARARHPRHPMPAWPAAGTRLPAPPLAEILYALSPAGDAGNPDAENRSLVAALLMRQQIACEIADAKFDLARDDAIAAMDAGDRERLLALLTDLPAELRLLDFIRESAAELAPNLPTDLAPLLWREYIIPWTRQSEVAHLLEP